jgi:hypothetical protein
VAEISAVAGGVRLLAALQAAELAAADVMYGPDARVDLDILWVFIGEVCKLGASHMQHSSQCLPACTCDIISVSSITALSEQQMPDCEMRQGDGCCVQVHDMYREVPYHNFFHCVDVTHATFRFIKLMGNRARMTPVEKLSLMIAALCHDLDHPGEAHCPNRLMALGTACLPILRCSL